MTTAPIVAPSAPDAAMKNVSIKVKLELNPTNPARGNISSLGIGGKIVSANAAMNIPRYPYEDTRDVIILIISTLAQKRVQLLI